jgi:hypothetical protein
MPFTLAHPIATAPIWFGSNKKLDLPSLFIGSMIPDIDYFLFLHPIKTVGHTFFGILIQGIPYSIVLLLVSRYALVRPFLALIPLQLARRFPPPKRYFPLAFMELINIIFSIAIGAATHLIWDAFTHAGGSVVVQSALLESMVGSLPIYKLLQYGGGVFGLVALSLWLSIWLNRSESRYYVETLAPRWRLLVTTCILLCAFGVAMLAMEHNQLQNEPFADGFVRSIIGWISGVSLGLLLYSVIFWMINSFKSDSSAT